MSRKIELAIQNIKEKLKEAVKKGKEKAREFIQFKIRLALESLVRQRQGPGPTHLSSPSIVSSTLPPMQNNPGNLLSATEKKRVVQETVARYKGQVKKIISEEVRKAFGR
jgi:hypothetical protein